MKQNRSLARALGIGVLGCILLAPASKAAELAGLTRDAVDDNAIASVKVRLFTPGPTPYTNALSDGTGKYRIADIKAGHYSIAFEKTGYSALPKGAEVDLKESDVRQENATLYRQSPDTAYVVALAGKIKEKAHESPSIVEGYEKEWAKIEPLDLSDEVKRQLAYELKQQDGEAMNVAAIKNYDMEFRDELKRQGDDLRIRIPDTNPPGGLARPDLKKPSDQMYRFPDELKLQGMHWFDEDLMQQKIADFKIDPQSQSPVSEHLYRVDSP